MIDYRQIYQFRIRKRGTTIRAETDIALRIPFATWHERQLHAKYAKDRYKDVQDVPWHQWGQRICKVGISKDAEARRKQFERKPESGKTETFAFTPGQQAAVRNQIIMYWLRWQILRWSVIGGATLWLLSEPWR